MCAAGLSFFLLCSGLAAPKVRYICTEHNYISMNDAKTKVHNSERGSGFAWSWRAKSTTKSMRAVQFSSQSKNRKDGKSQHLVLDVLGILYYLIQNLYMLTECSLSRCWYSLCFWSCLARHYLVVHSDSKLCRQIKRCLHNIIGTDNCNCANAIAFTKNAYYIV